MTIKTPDYIVTYEETPEYLTTGKRYPLNDDFEDGLYRVLDDYGTPIIVHIPECAHLDWKKWKKGYRFHV